MGLKINANPKINGIRINPKSISFVEDNKPEIKYQKKISNKGSENPWNDMKVILLENEI